MRREAHVWHGGRGALATLLLLVRSMAQQGKAVTDAEFWGISAGFREVITH